MQILLPPSEGKTWPQAGDPVILEQLFGGADLRQHRHDVMHALIAASVHPDALAILGVSKGLSETVARNADLLTSPADAAFRVYSGVLFDAANLPTLLTAQPAANDHIVVFSALYGAVRPDQAISAYRLSGGVDLPGIGSVNTSWRRRLQPLLDDAFPEQLIVDCRSGTYQSMWHPQDSSRWVTVRVLQEVNGVPKVVSHHAKHTRGLLTHHLLSRTSALPASSEDLIDAASELIGEALIDVALIPQRRGPQTLEITIR